MKAYYKTILKGEGHDEFSKPEDVYEYECLEITDICCPNMEEALREEAIGFGEFLDHVLNRDCQINLAEFRSYGPSFWSISFCPFCGAPIETEERERFTRKRVTKVIPEKKQTGYDLEKVEGK